MIDVAEQADTATARTRAATTKQTSRISPKLIENVSVELQALLGGASMTVGELAALKPGSSIALDARLNDPVELRLDDKVVARGELVAVGERFGVRLTEIAQWQD